MLNISFLGGYISQDSNSQNYTGQTYYNSNSDMSGNTFGAVSGVNSSAENWDQSDKPSYSYYAQTPSTGGSLYKTKLWRHYITKGFCSLAEKWNFAHGEVELRNSLGTDYQTNSWPTLTPAYAYQPKPTYSYLTNDQKYYKTVLCRNFQENGSCQFGEKWKFAHGDTDIRPILSTAYQAVDYSSFPPPAYGSYPAESLPPTDAYYNYGANYTNYQDSTTPGAYAGSSAPPESTDKSQVYNYSYDAYPGYYPGYNYGTATTEGSAATATPGLQTYYPQQSSDSYLNKKSE